MNDDLKAAIASFVAASARYVLVRNPNLFQGRDELYEAWDALAAAWKRHRP